MFLDLAVLKMAKYGLSTGGDSVEVAERPGGGLSVVVVDGQGSGIPAKRISSAVATKAAALIADGVRDGAAARAVHDYIYALRRAQVQASLIILSADMTERRLIASRNSQCPAIYLASAGIDVMAEKANVLGLHPMVRPLIQHFTLEPSAALVAFTDGLLNAGRWRGQPVDLSEMVRRLEETLDSGAEAMANAVFNWALAADDGRPQDDMTAVVLKVEHDANRGPVRRMHIRYPV